jgi:hypothetical protein
MTWEEFKKKAEEAGARDTDEITYISIFTANEVHVSKRQTWDGKIEIEITEAG